MMSPHSQHLYKKRGKKISAKLILLVILVLLIGYFLINKLTDSFAEKLIILHTNNMEAQFDAFNETTGVKTSSVGGLDRIYTIVDSIRSQNKNVLLLDSGDTIKATLFTRVTGVKKIAKLINELKYNAIGIGEHDFDQGPVGFKKFLTSANFPFLAANLDVSKAEEFQDLIPPYSIVNFGNFKVGIFGLTTHEVNIYASKGPDIIATDPYTSAKQTIKKLKDKVDVIILLSHLGLAEDRKLVSRVPGIDIIIGGHSKTKLSSPLTVLDPEGNETIIVQAKSECRYLGKLVLSVKNKKVKLLNYKLIAINDSIKSYEPLKKELLKFQTILNEETKKPIGKTAVKLDAIRYHSRIGETNIGNLYTKAIKELVPEADIVVQNSGGIRGEKEIPANTDLTIADIFDWHPFVTNIVLVTLTGAEVKELLERSVASLPTPKGAFLQVDGISFTIDLTGKPQILSDDHKSIKSPGDRIIDIKIANKPIDLNKDYRVAVNDFILNGGDAFVTLNKSRGIVYTNYSVTDILVNYIKKHSPIKPITDGRIKVKGGLLKQ